MIFSTARPEQGQKKRDPHDGLFVALRFPAFRLFWIGLMAVSSGTWLQGVAQDFLVLRLGGRGIDLGLVNAARAAAFIGLALWGGGLADRLDRRRLLMGTHTAFAVCSLLLGALMETALRCFERAGIARDDATRLMAPIARGTLDNVLALGTTKALTGPIARGDHAVVARQCAALSGWDEDMALAYMALGRMALQLSSKQGNAGAQDLETIRDVLDDALVRASERTGDGS